MHNVPKNIKKITEIDRRLIPIIKINRPNTNVISFDKLLAILGAIGDMMANAIKGKLVSNATLQLEKPTSSRIVPMSGPTDVIAGRKLNAINTTPITNKV